MAPSKTVQTGGTHMAAELLVLACTGNMDAEEVAAPEDEDLVPARVDVVLAQVPVPDLAPARDAARVKALDLD